jgi:hypothetical protein
MVGLMRGPVCRTIGARQARVPGTTLAIEGRAQAVPSAGRRRGRIGMARAMQAGFFLIVWDIATLTILTTAP